MQQLIEHVRLGLARNVLVSLCPGLHYIRQDF